MIYRQYSCNITKANCYELLVAIAHCGAQITSTLSTAKRYDRKTMQHCTMHFMLKFLYPADLQRFHDLGFETKEPEGKLCI